MPNSRSAAKRLRNQTSKGERKKAAVSELKTLAQKLNSLDKNPEEAKTFAQKVISRYDRAVSRGLIPRGRADRKKSRVARFLARLSSKKAA